MVEHCNQYLIPIDSHIKWLDIEIVSNKLWIPWNYSHDIPMKKIPCITTHSALKIVLLQMVLYVYPLYYP